MAMQTKNRYGKCCSTLLTMNRRPKHFDATDALAVAICHHFQCKFPVNWRHQKESFKKNEWLGRFYCKKSGSRPLRV